MAIAITSYYYWYINLLKNFIIYGIYKLLKFNVDLILMYIVLGRDYNLDIINNNNK